MLIRRAYEPRVMEHATLPALDAISLDGSPLNSRLFIGAFTSAAMEVGIWLRLAGAATPVVYFVDPADDIEAITPPSQIRSTFVGSNVEEWQALIQPDRPERAFAVIDDLLVIGAPTEEVWERFEGILNS